MPNIWCPGCGHGIVVHAIAKVIRDLEYQKDDVVVVSGIGCSSRAPGYMDFNTLHTTHGRAIAFATGVKLANPKLKVVVITGDGDAAAIGGNHLIHGARRNIDMTVIVFNNNIYGMTGGQFSPTTEIGEYGTTAPYGNVDPPFDISKLTVAAGATYVARATAYHANLLYKYIKKGMEKNGFAMIEAISSCPTYYGRKNKKGDAVGMLEWFRDSFIDVRKAGRMKDEDLVGKHLMGEFTNIERPEYTEEYSKLIARFQEKK